MSTTNNTVPATDTTSLEELKDSTFKPVSPEVENTGIPSALGDPASTPPSEGLLSTQKEPLGTKERLKELAKDYAYVGTEQVEGGVELYLFTQTKVPHPTFVETIRQKLANKEDVGDNHIHTGKTIEEILDNLK